MSTLQLRIIVGIGFILTGIGILVLSWQVHKLQSQVKNEQTEADRE